MTDFDELRQQALRDKRRTTFLLLIALALVVAVMGYGWYSSSVRYEQERTQTEALLQKYTELYSEFTAKTGSQPNATAPNQVQAAKGDPGDQGPPGPVGPQGPGPTAIQLLNAFRTYCSVAVCVGPPGPISDVPGPQGKQGEPGTPGKDGTDGINGINGVDGKDGTDGTNGTNGTDGTNGIGISNIQCNDSNDWVFTMSNNTTITVTGPCRVTTPTASFMQNIKQK